MRLLIGPPGSGKTSLVLDELRAALGAGDPQVRLLVPTATLAQHLQNRIAREGFLIRRNLIQTLSAFVNEWCEDLPQVTEAALYLMVEDCVRRVNRPEFQAVAVTAGFSAMVARTVAEFSSAGCDSERLARSMPDSPLGDAFLAVYREVDRALERHGLALRARRLERAAERIEASGCPGIRTVWLDGFHALPDPELRLIQALTRHAHVSVTLSETGSGPTRARQCAMGFAEHAMPSKRTTPARVLVRAPSIEREVEDIARRVLEQAAAGRPFREIGIIVRSAAIYVPLLRTTLERFGIPARFYFDQPLEEHAVARFLTGAVDAMLSGWDHEQTLGVVRLAPPFARSNRVDRWDFAVRGQIPNSGLGGLKELAGEAGADRVEALLNAMGKFEEWRSLTLQPKDWAAQMAALPKLFRAAVPEKASHQTALELRAQAAALDLFEEALAEAAAVLDAAHAIEFEPYWRAVKAVIRLKPLRLTDRRRNVVQVLSAQEARQWVLPVVFVCGLVEKQFPQFHRQDPFFPEAARLRLHAAGIRVRTAEEFEREERALFDTAISRATLLVTLSYPEFDGRGERNLRSLFLEGLPEVVEEPSRLVRPQARCTAAPRPPVEIRAADLMQELGRRTARLSPSGLEAFLQCPFLYFGQRLLRLKTAPPRPQDRLDFLTQGNIVHDVLAQWYSGDSEIAPLFESVFKRVCEEKSIPLNYHTERLRNAMRDDLSRFAADHRWPRGEFASRTEAEFEFPVDESLSIKGKIDRLDTAPDGRAYVVDYKYSPAQTVRRKRGDELLLQAPLYALAAEKKFGVEATGVFYLGLKGKVEYAGWSRDGFLKAVPVHADWLPRAMEKTLRAAHEIRAGRVEAAPADTGRCGRCECRDVCRVAVRVPLAEETEAAL